MPTHSIIQRQQELIRSLNSLLENYEQDVKRATDVAAKANEAAKIEHSREMQEANTPLSRIRSIKRDARPFKYNLLKYLNANVLTDTVSVDFNVSSYPSTKGYSPASIATTGVDPVRQLHACQSITEEANRKLIAFREKPRFYFIIGRLVSIFSFLAIFMTGFIIYKIFSMIGVLLSQNFYFQITIGILSLVIAIIAPIVYHRSLNLRIRNLCVTIDHASSTAEILYQQQTQTLEPVYQRQIEQNQQQYNETVRKLDRSISKKIAGLHKTYMGFVQETRFSGAEWSDSALWKQWQPPQAITPTIRLGMLTIKIRQRPLTPVPLFVSCPGGENLLFKVDGNARNVASATVQSLIVRLLSTQPPGCVRFTFIDPVDMEQSVEAFTQLSSYDPALVTSRVWTEPAHIEQQLSEISEYITHVIHTVFRGSYATIEEYNERSGQSPLPYRVLVVLGFPFGFTLNRAHRLVNIAKNGARCGVSTVVVFDSKQPQPQGFDLTDLELVSTVISWDGTRFTWRGVDVGKSMASATVAYGTEMDVFEGR